MRRVASVVLLLLLAGCLSSEPAVVREVEFTAPTGVIAGDPVRFETDRLQYPEGAVFLWELGDGSGAVGPMVEHTYAEGSYTVTLTVVARDGATGSASRTIEILHRNIAPVADAGPGQQVPVHTNVSFDGRDSRDPEQEPLSFAWDFGDGTAGSGPTPSHNYTAAGNYTVNLTVTDAEGLSDNASTWVEVRLRHYNISFVERQKVRQPTGYTAEGATSAWDDSNATHNLTLVEFRLVWQDETYYYRDPIFGTELVELGPIPNQEDNFTLAVTPPHIPGNSSRGESEELLLLYPDINPVPADMGPLEGESEAEIWQWLAGQGYTRATGFDKWAINVTCNDAPPDGGLLEGYLTDDDPGNDWTLTITFHYYEATVTEVSL